MRAGELSPTPSAFEAAAEARADRALGRHQRAATRSVFRRPLTIVGLVIIVFWALAALLAPWVTEYGPLEQSTDLYASPSAAHWFGTDELGRDVFSRIIHGSRITLPLAVMLVALACTTGAILGGIAGYAGRLADEGVMRVADLVFAFPHIILAMAVAAALGPSLRNAVLALVAIAWPLYARVTRGLVLATRELDYVLASRLTGASARAALAVDILPNIAGPIAVLATLELGTAVLWLSGLSFLGLGAQPPDPEWGAMVSAGAQAFNHWWVGTFPGLAILTAVLAFNFIGDSLRDALDPRVARVIRRDRV
jgi:peptide/nickel transport system permease protein